MHKNGHFLRKRFGAADIDLFALPHKVNKADPEREVEIALYLKRTHTQRIKRALISFLYPFGGRTTVRFLGGWAGRVEGITLG